MNLNIDSKIIDLENIKEDTKDIGSYTAIFSSNTLSSFKFGEEYKLSELLSPINFKIEIYRDDQFTNNIKTKDDIIFSWNNNEGEFVLASPYGYENSSTSFPLDCKKEVIYLLQMIHYLLTNINNPKHCLLNLNCKELEHFKPLKNIFKTRLKYYDEPVIVRRNELYRKLESYV